MIAIRHLGILLVACAICYITGHLLLWRIKRDASFGNLSWLFFKLLAGFICCTVVFACVKTGFSTVYMAMLPLIAAGCFYLKRLDGFITDKDARSNLRTIEYKELIGMAAVAVIVSFLQCGELFNFAGAPLRLDHDVAFYAQVGASMDHSGVETVALGLLDGGNGNPLFYHYFEIWFALLFSDVFGLNILNSIALVSYAFMQVLIVVGSAAVLQQCYRAGPFKALLCALPIIFMGHFRWFEGDEAIFATFTSVLSTLRVQKLSLVYISLLLFLLLLNKKDLFARVFPFCLMFLLYGPTLPVAFSCVSLYLLYMFAMRKKFGRDMLYSSSALLVSAAGIALFYYLMDSPDPSSKEVKFYISGLSIDHAGHYATQVSSFFFEKLIFYGLHILIPVLFLTRAFIKKEITQKRMLDAYGLPSLAVFLGLCLYSATYRYADSFQLFTNIFIPFISLLVFLVASFLLFSRSILQRILAAFIICIQFVANFTFHRSQPIDRSYYESISGVMRNNDGNCAYVFDEETVRDSPDIFSANVIFVNGDLTRYTNRYVPEFLNPFELLKYSEAKDQDASYIRLSVIQNTFYRYVMAERANGDSNKAISDYQYDFIRNNNIRFLIADKNSQWLKRSPFKVKRIVESDEEPFWFVEIY